MISDAIHQADPRSLDRHLLHSLPNSEDQDLVIVTGGAGLEVWDDSGRRYLDAMSGVWNVSLGYGRTDLAEAAGRQLADLAYGSTYSGFANVPALRLAAAIAEKAYPGLDTTFFTVSGADANEAAVKMARFVWDRRGRPEKVKVLSLDHGFYGMTLAMVSAGGMAAFRAGFGPRLPGYVSVPAPYPYRCDFAKAGETPGQAAARRLEDAIEAEGADTIAALLIEPVQGSAGVIVPPDDYVPLVRRICDRHDITMIADEVITGFGRTGEWFALTHWDTVPDLVTFGKGASSGYLPLGGVIVSAEIADTIRACSGDERWMHSSTFSGHPACCAAGLKTIEIIESEQLLDRVSRSGATLRDRLGSLVDMPAVGEVRGLGLLAGVELVADRDSRAPFAPELRVGDRVRQAAQERGLLVRSRADTINIAPSFVITDSEIDTLTDVLRQSIAQVTGDLS